MTDNDKDGFTFDPRTWSSPPAAETDRPAPSNGPMADAPSPSPAREPGFDLKNWGRGDGDDSPPSAEADGGADGKIARADRRRWIIAGGMSAVVLAAGGGLAFLSRNPQVPFGAQPGDAAPTDPQPGAAGGASAPPSRRTLNVSGPAEIETALRSAGIVDADVGTANKLALAALGPAAGEIRLDFDIQGPPGAMTLLQFEATRGDGSGISLKRNAEGGFARERLDAALTTRINVVRGEMDGDSFYTSAVAAGVTDSLISDFANAFSFDFNFQTEVHAGDVFEAAFEQAYNPSDQPVGVPKLVYVSLSTSAKSRSLYRFTAPGETAPSWFDGNGHSTVRALMLTPVDGARITSKFGPRFHPVLHFNKMHNGTDFAAPIGTPIYASGNAVVEWAAMKGANGNLTVLRHDNGWRTLYLHQNMFMPGIAPGARVSQGQKIGEIGTTGRSTGPHLHYEVHIDGAPVDPMSIDTGIGKTLSGAALAAFEKERDRIDTHRAEAAH